MSEIIKQVLNELEGFYPCISFSSAPFSICRCFNLSFLIVCQISTKSDLFAVCASLM